MRFKYNIRLIKWLLTVFILIFNIALNGDNLIFNIVFGVSINIGAIIVFIVLSILPRRFYVISSEEISYQNGSAKELWHINVKDIIYHHYVGIGLIPISAEITYIDENVKKCRNLFITYKQYLEIIKILNLS